MQLLDGFRARVFRAKYRNDTSFHGSLVYIISLLAAYNRDERTLSPESYRMGRDWYFLIGSWGV